MTANPFPALAGASLAAMLFLLTAPPAGAVSISSGASYGVASNASATTRCGLQAPIVDQLDPKQLVESGTVTSSSAAAGGSFECRGATIGYSLQARGVANLAAGSVGVLAAAEGGSTGAEAVLKDTITLHGFGGLDPIPVVIPVSASGLSRGNVFNGGFLVSASTTDLTAPQNLGLSAIGLTPDPWEASTTPTGPDLPRLYNDVIQFSLPASDPTFRLDMRMELGAAGGNGLPPDDPFALLPGLGAFINTGSVDLVLPPGVGFTSASGVFLSQPAGTAIPAPAAVWLLGPAALFLLGARLRHGRRPGRSRG